MGRRLTLGITAVVAVIASGCSNIPEGAAEAEAFECPVGTEGCPDLLPVGPGGEMTLEGGDFYFEVLENAPVTGEVEVTLVNVADQYHNAQFVGAAEGSGIPEAEGGEEGTDSVLLFPGEWTVFCNVPGHRAAGMETTITVYASEEEAAAAAEAEGEGAGATTAG